MNEFFGFAVLIFSVVLHEVAHGYMANYLGDPTARLQKRLTLNPVSHIDPVGTILVPLIQLLTMGKVFIGWAKPVPFNPYNLPGKYDEALVSFAGPGTNILLALIFGLAIRFNLDFGLTAAFLVIVEKNIILALFNLMPVPPLDGSKVLGGILPGFLGDIYNRFRFSVERLGILGGMPLVLLAFFILSPYFLIALYNLMSLLTGLSV